MPVKTHLVNDEIFIWSYPEINNENAFSLTEMFDRLGKKIYCNDTAFQESRLYVSGSLVQNS